MGPTVSADPAWPVAVNRLPAVRHRHIMWAMPVELNHHIVHARDPEASARFLSEMLGLPAPTRFSHFVVVEADNGVSLGR